MVKWSVLEEVKQDPNVVTLGLFGSVARQKKGFDVDVFVLVKGEVDQIRKKLFEAGFDVAVNNVYELDKIDPVFLAAVARSFKPIKGELKIEIDDYIIENELRSAIIHHFMRLRDGLVSHEYRSALILNAFNATRYACWLLLYKRGLSLPSNSSEMLTLLRGVAPNVLFKLFENSLLAIVERDLDVGKTKLKKTSLLYTVLSVAEALKLTADPLKEAEEWVKHVDKRVMDIDPRDAMSIRELCQSLFMAVYNVTRGYLTAKKGYAPETHVEIFHALEEIKDLDPHAVKIEEDYREAFHRLHVDCHYRGVGSLELVRKWITKTRNLIHHVKAII